MSHVTASPWCLKPSAELVGDVAAADDDGVLGRVDPFADRRGIVPVLKVVDALDIGGRPGRGQRIWPTARRDQQAFIRKRLAIGRRRNSGLGVQRGDERIDEQLDTLLLVLFERPQKDLFAFGLVAQERR